MSSLTLLRFLGAGGRVKRIIKNTNKRKAKIMLVPTSTDKRFID